MEQNRQQMNPVDLANALLLQITDGAHKMRDIIQSMNNDIYKMQASQKPLQEFKEYNAK